MTELLLFSVVSWLDRKRSAAEYSRSRRHFGSLQLLLPIGTVPSAILKTILYAGSQSFAMRRKMVRRRHSPGSRRLFPYNVHAVQAPASYFHDRGPHIRLTYRVK